MAGGNGNGREATPAVVPTGRVNKSRAEDPIPERRVSSDLVQCPTYLTVPWLSSPPRLSRTHILFPSSPFARIGDIYPPYTYTHTHIQTHTHTHIHKHQSHIHITEPTRL